MRSKLKRLEKAMRGRLDHVELADGTRHYFDPEETSKTLFLYFTDSMRADWKREPRPEPPEVLKAVANARDRGEALSRVMNGSSFLSDDGEASSSRAFAASAYRGRALRTQAHIRGQR